MSDQHFRAGQKELELGHVGAAKQEFDQAITLLMESSYGGRTEPRIREHFDRLVDRISAYEIKALAAGDGFTEKRYEPASIDELLALSATFTQPPAAPELADAVAADLQTVGYDVPIPFNQKVLSYIDLFQGRLHDFIQEGLTRGSKYLPMIQSVFRAEGLPLDLAYIPLIESAFKTNALSRAQAKGVWQFMRGTGIENGLRHDWYIDERSDPEKATIAAAKYLSTLSKMFEGDWHLALASYNGGPGRVQRAMKRGRLSDFWRLSAKANLLPRETREYVPMILAAVVIARNPAQYGFAFEPEPLPSYQLVTLPGPVDLRRIAEWIDTPIDEIQALNPELRRWTTPVKDRSYALKVPVGCGRHRQRSPRGGCHDRPGVAEVVHGAERRDAGHHCAEPARQPHGPRGGELPQDHLEGDHGPEAHGAARGHGPDDGAGGAPGTRRRIARDHHRRGRASDGIAQLRAREDHVQGEEGRYARVDRAGVQDDGRLTADLEPHPRFRHQGR